MWPERKISRREFLRGLKALGGVLAGTYILNSCHKKAPIETDQERMNRLFTNSGIGKRLVEIITEHPTEGVETGNFSAKDCNFGVMTSQEDPATGHRIENPEVTREIMTIEFPTLSGKMVNRIFDIEEDGSFGMGPKVPPLTPKQYRLFRSLLSK